VQVYDVIVENDGVYIVMEYVNGQTLQSILDVSPPARRETARILASVASALDYIHSKGIIHRDVKPSNIMIASKGDVKLMDFGIATEIGSGDERRSVIVGTPSFMSPEQISRPGTVGPASDEFSLAAVAYEMLTGRAPFDPSRRDSQADSDFSLQFRTVYQSVTPPSHLSQDLDGRVDQVFEKALAKNPSDRFESCRGFVGALTSALRLSTGGAEFNTKGSQASVPHSDSTGTDKVLARAEETQTGTQGNEETIGRRATIISQLESQSVPAGFASEKHFRATGYFSNPSQRFEHIADSLKFYRDSMRQEYAVLTNRGELTYRLWVACVCLGFVTLLVGILLMFTADLARGAVTLASTTVIYFLQKVFHKREDHYRKLADEKNAHLEYGNQWLLAIQSIDAIEDSQERLAKQTRLADVLTAKLGPRVSRTVRSDKSQRSR
jgi:serine/threonine protein kinase